MQLSKNLELATATRYQRRFIEVFFFFFLIFSSLFIFGLFLLFLMELELGNTVLTTKLKVDVLLCYNVSESFSPSRKENISCVGIC